MKITMNVILIGILCILLLGPVGSASAKVTAQEAEQLNTTLTPFGAEKAGNADGAIPTWEGGYTTPIPGFENGGRRPDPFKDDKPLFSINAKNMDKYADKLSEGQKALLKKYPATYRIDVYKTRRTVAAPQWVYDNTYTNATRAYTDGDDIKGAYGGIPFPIPKSGLEVMWNHLLRHRPSAWHFQNDAMLGTSSGKVVMLNKVEAAQMMPYYLKDQNLEGYEKDWNGEFWMIRLLTMGPPMRAGEGIVGRENLAGKKTKSWVYLTGQRRVRQLPVSCCDTPTPAVAGVAFFDETMCFNGSEALQRFDFKIIGKKEMYIPYNCNKILEPQNIDEVVLNRHLNPDYVRWELHRVWVVEATLREGKRHSCVLNQYYIDEDSWMAALSDRYDANGELWRSGYTLPMVLPDVPAVVALPWGFFDLKANTWAASNMYNAYGEQYKVMPPYKDMVFTPSALQSEGVR